MEEARGGNKGAEKREKECGREREEFCAVVKNPDPAHRVESWGPSLVFRVRGEAQTVDSGGSQSRPHPSARRSSRTERVSVYQTLCSGVVRLKYYVSGTIES